MRARRRMRERERDKERERRCDGIRRLFARNALAEGCVYVSKVLCRRIPPFILEVKGIRSIK